MSEIRKVLVYAILPAIIAGLFALIPKIYDEINEPKASLEYVVFNGPHLKVGEHYKRIVSIKVENTGKRALSNIIAIVDTYADVESKNLTSSIGFEPNMLRDSMVKVSADKMHPYDEFTLSLMLSSKSHIVPPQIALRADEVLGTIKIEQRSKSTGLSFISGILSGFSVFVMAMFFIIKVQFSGALPNALSKKDNIFYISAKIGSGALVNAINEYSGHLSYLRFSDILFYLGKSGEMKKQDALSGLECLLLITEIADSSMKHIERNIEALSDYDLAPGYMEQIKNRRKSIKNSIHLRNAIDEHIDSFEVF